MYLNRRLVVPTSTLHNCLKNVFQPFLCDQVGAPVLRLDIAWEEGCPTLPDVLCRTKAKMITSRLKKRDVIIFAFVRQC